MKEQHTLEFANLYVYDSYIIAEIFEGIDFNTELNTTLLDFCKQTFGDTPYGYISNRVHSYAVDPTVYSQSAAYPNLAAIAVVAHNEIGRINAEIEKLFFQKKFEHFKSLDRARIWMKEALTTIQTEEPNQPRSFE